MAELEGGAPDTAGPADFKKLAIIDPISGGVTCFVASTTEHFIPLGRVTVKVISCLFGTVKLIGLGKQ